MHLLLTGGTGFFGKSLLRYFITNNSSVTHRVTVLSREPAAFLRNYPEFSSDPRISFHQGNILLPISLPHHKQFTHVIHAAADSTYGHLLKPIDLYDQIVTGTRNILQFSLDHSINRFLYVSSGAVYGMQPPTLHNIPEHYIGSIDNLDLCSVYANAKRAAESLCVLFNHQYSLQTVIARCFSFVGPDLPLDSHFAISNFIQNVVTNKPILIQGTGNTIRSYLSQTDLSSWLLTLLLKGSPGEVYNIGHVQAISILELAHIVKSILCSNVPIQVLNTIQESTIRQRYVPDISKIKSQYSLEPVTLLSNAILSTAKYYTLSLSG